MRYQSIALENLILRTNNEEFKKSSTASAFMDAPNEIEKIKTKIEDAFKSIPEGDANTASCLNDLGDEFQNRFDETQIMDYLDAEIRAYDEAVKATSEDDPNRVSRLIDVAISLNTRFEWTKSMIDLSAAINVNEEAVALTPGGTP